jgi:hypothetical protein
MFNVGGKPWMYIFSYELDDEAFFRLAPGIQ